MIPKPKPAAAANWPQGKLGAWLPALALMASIFALSARPDLGGPGWLSALFASAFGQLPWLMAWLPVVERLDPWAATAGHLAAYGALAPAFYLGVRRQWPAVGRPALAAWSLALLYGISDEWHQHFVPGRHADPWDLVVDGLGAAVALAAAVAWVGWRRAGAIRHDLPSHTSL